MKHLRGSGVAIALIVLLAGAALAAGDQIADLESKVAKIEAALKEESADLRPMILRELTAARRELRQALQERFDMLSELAATTPEEQKAKSARLEKLRSRIDELNRQLAAEAPAPSSSAAPAPAAPAAAPAPAAPAPPAASAAATPPADPPDPTPTAPQAAAAAALQFAPKEAPIQSLKLRVDVVRDWSATSAKKSCSNRPYSHSAGVWRVEILAYPIWETGAEFTDEDGLLRYKDSVLYMPVAVLRKDPGVNIVIGSRTYVATSEQTTHEVKLVFDRLTLSEAGDLVDHLAANKDEIISAYASAVARYEIFQVAFQYTLKSGKPLSADSMYGVVACHVDPTAEAQAMRQQLIRAQDDKGMLLETCVPLDAQGQPVRPAEEVRIQARKPVDKSSLLKTATFDAEWAKQVKDMIPALVNAEQNESSSDKEQRKDLEEKAKSKTSGVSLTQPLIVDDPCFQLSAAPVLTGQEIHPATSFRFRYDLYSPDDKLTLKLRGEGETADTSNYFQRMKISGEGTGLFVKRQKGWQAAAAIVGQYSFTRVSDTKLDEWKAGGKFEVKAPFVRIFNTGTGANSRPTFSLEGSAAGGNGSTTKTTDFDLETNFVYTLRPSPRFSFDLKAQGGWSSKARFASEKSFSYFNILGRYNFSAEWDYVVKYECGRKDPDYRKFCGWQTGFLLVTGR